MIKYVAVMPYVYEPFAVECLKTMHVELIRNLLAIDNTKENKGVAGSWDFGIDKMREADADWLIVMSAAITFGVIGGLDMIEQLEKHPEAHVVHFAEAQVPEQKYIRGTSLGYDDGILGWHLTAVRADVIEKVGYFDPNFFPVYVEDIDYDLRVNKAYPNVEWLILPIDAHRGALRHAVELGGVQTPIEELNAYYKAKWGYHPSGAKTSVYEFPFNNPANGLNYFPEAHERSYEFQRS